MKLTVIIPTYNSKDYIIDCIQSVKDKTKNLEHEIIVVDNNSSDNTVSSISKNFNQIDIVMNDKNYGYSKAVNIGLMKGKGEFICVLNPDTIILSNAFEVLISYLEENRNIGCVGPKILNKDGTFQFSCRRNFPYIKYLLPKFFLLDQKFPHSHFLNSYNFGSASINQTWHVNSISGSFMLLPKSVVEIVGLFDENFFMFWEDTDYCNRVAESGFLVTYNNNAEITHFKGGSRISSKLPLDKIFYESLLYFFKKYKNRYSLWKYTYLLPIIGLNLVILILSINYNVKNSTLVRKLVHNG